MWRRFGVLGFLAVVAAIGAVLFWPHLKSRIFPADVDDIRARLTPTLATQFAEQGLDLGAPVFMRIFKQERELEVWVQGPDRFELFKTYPICNHSGDLGPKLREGDRQSPEGFYFVTPDRMNPNSAYHLSFNLGFPNAFDQAAGRTGSFLMVHGNCVSVGCYAMTDAGIEEIYTVAQAALDGGQPFFRVHAFPFRMTASNMARHSGHKWAGFWRNLKEGYDHFESTGWPPNVTVSAGQYSFEADS